MKGQNIKKHQQKELNLMCKTDKKTINYVISMPRDKMPNASRKNWICESELTIDLRGQMETKYKRISILVLLRTANIWENNRK